MDLLCAEADLLEELDVLDSIEVSTELSSFDIDMSLDPLLTASLFFNAIFNDFSLILGANVASFISSTALSSCEAFNCF